MKIPRCTSSHTEKYIPEVSSLLYKWFQIYLVTNFFGQTHVHSNLVSQNSVMSRLRRTKFGGPDSFPIEFNVKRSSYVKFFSSNFWLRRSKFYSPKMVSLCTVPLLPLSVTAYHTSPNKQPKCMNFGPCEQATRYRRVTNCKRHTDT